MVPNHQTDYNALSNYNNYIFMIKISPEILPILGGDRCPPGFQTLPRSAAQGAVHADGLVACEAPILQEASVPLRASLG